MGGLARKMERRQARQAYEDFSKAWDREKRFQLHTKATAGSLPSGTTDITVRQKLPFGHWMKAMEQRQKQIRLELDEAKKRMVAEKENELEAEWEETPASAG